MAPHGAPVSCDSVNVVATLAPKQKQVTCARLLRNDQKAAYGCVNNEPATSIFRVADTARVGRRFFIP
jgi:hypothetical protein